MVSVLVLILALIALYVLARIFVQKLFIVLYRLTRDRDEASVILGIIFLPGTFIHEMSHFITALFLLVPVGRINLMPEVMEDGVKMGSAEVGKVDFLRMSLIGLAPLIVGGGIIFWAISLALMPGNLGKPWLIALMVLLIFQITHSMFSSKKDMEALLELGVFIVIVAVTLIVLKIFWPFTFIYGKILEVGPFIQRFSYFLFIPISLELIFLGLFRKIRF